MSEEKTYKQMQAEFSKKFYTSMAPRIQQYEDERVFTLLICLILFVFFVACAVWIFYTGFKYNGGLSEGKVKLALLFIFTAFGIYWIKKKNFENKVKTRIMPYVCKCFGNLKWQCFYPESTPLIKSSMIINNYDGLDYDDVFSGQFKDVNFEIMEMEFTKGSGKNRTTIFDGVIVKLDMNKDFIGHTIIRPDTLLHLNPSKKLKHTELEDIQFEKKFDVFTDDEVEARYLITPSFMERLNEMKVAFTADKVSCAFYKKYLFIALHTSEDLFSICSLFKRVDDPKQFFTMFEEILSIIKLIDHFKLNQKIGL